MALRPSQALLRRGAGIFDAQGPNGTPIYRPTPPPNHPSEVFEPWTTPAKRAQVWEEENKGRPPAKDPWQDYVPETVREKLPYDGLDPLVYGDPSGIFGLRLMLNPDFFGKTKDAAERAHTGKSAWRTQTGDIIPTPKFTQTQFWCGHSRSRCPAASVILVRIRLIRRKTLRSGLGKSFRYHRFTILGSAAGVRKPSQEKKFSASFPAQSGTRHGRHVASKH